jgi:two-component system, cell cycle sensor histidine kinase and response regulator CckA
MKIKKPDSFPIALPDGIFCKAFSSSQAFMAITEHESGRYVEVNEAFCRLFGFQREECLGRTVGEVGMATDEQYGKIARELLKRSGTQYGIQLRSKNGAVKHARVSASMVEIDGKRFLAWSGTDLTEQKVAEEALRAVEAKFHAILEGVSEAIIIHDLNGRILEVNRKACELVGYSKEELMRLTPIDLDAHKEKLPERFVTMIREGSLTVTSDLIRKDGTHLPVELGFQLIQYGGQRAFLGIVRDLS